MLPGGSGGAFFFAVALKTLRGDRHFRDKWQKRKEKETSSAAIFTFAQDVEETITAAETIKISSFDA